MEAKREDLLLITYLSYKFGNTQLLVCLNINLNQ